MLSVVYLSRNTLIASQSQVYKLEPKPFEQQVSQLVQHRQFDLALQIAVCFSLFLPSSLPPSLSLSSLSLQDLIDEDRERKQERRNGIVRRFAFYEFSNHKFKESLEHYLEIREGGADIHEP